MKQTIFARQERPLLKHVISKLNPDIFVHPVWIRFWRTDENSSQKTVELLAKLVQELEVEQPEDACRLHLICAFYQNLGGAGDLALNTLEQVIDLAKRTGFQSGVLWALWGSCAIRFQQEEYSLAASHIESLKSILSDQNEWMLAAFLEVIKQSLNQMETSYSSWHTASIDGSSSNDLIYFTYSWLQNWGVNFQTPELDGRQKWHHWHALEFFHKWGMKFNSNSKVRKPLARWQSVLSLLRLQEYHSNPTPRAGQGENEQKAVEMVSTVKTPENGLKPGMDFSVSETNWPKPKGSHKGQSSSRKKQDHISLTVQMLGPFSLTIGNVSPKLPASRALSVFKYLLLHYKQNIPREVLMDVFWPDVGADAARNNLNVTMHNLRQALRSVTSVQVIYFEDGAYHLAPSLEIWLDVEEFDHCMKEGKQLEAQNHLTLAVVEYEIAINLYRGDLLAESPYEEWMVLERERLRVAYMDTLDHLSQIHFNQEQYGACVTLCQLILSRDVCREDIHCRLMQCYSHLGQRSLALHQYQICVEALHAELDVDPAPETIYLYEQIRRHQ